MNDETRQSEVLTREELDALLASLAEERDREEARGRPFRAQSVASAGEIAVPALVRALEAFAREQTRHLSNVYQAKIEYKVLTLQSTTHGEFGDTLLDSDRIATFQMKPSGATGFMWLSRPLLFALLSLNFGSRPAAKILSPNRPYSGIEHRIYRRSVVEILGQLDRCWEDLLQTESTNVVIEPPAYLQDQPEARVLLVNVDVQGLAGICRMRVGLPEKAFESLKDINTTAAPQSGLVEKIVEEMPLQLRVELGSVEMSLAELTNLKAGSVIPLDTNDEGELTVMVEGQPKFRAIRGAVGRKIAVQLTERLERAAEAQDGSRV